MTNPKIVSLHRGAEPDPESPYPFQDWIIHELVPIVFRLAVCSLAGALICAGLGFDTRVGIGVGILLGMFAP